MSLRAVAKGLPRTEEQRKFKITELGQILEEQYLNGKKPDGFVKKKSFAPSKLGYGEGTCPRYWWHAFHGAEFINDTDALGIAGMAYGSEAGVRVANLFDEAGLLIEAEAKAEHSDPPVFGYIDVIVNWNGETVVGEIKTTRQEMFTIRETTMLPTPYNLIQILIYMKIKNLRRGFLLYENKNTQEFVTIPVVMNEKNSKFIDDVFEWMRTVYAAVQEETMPERPFTKNSKVCKNCPVRQTCWGDEPGTVKLLPLEVNLPE